MAAEGRVYLSGQNLEELQELLEGGFLDEDKDFNRELESATTTEENVEGKKVYVCEICGKECVSARGLKRHETLKKTKENCFTNFTDSQFEEIVKECAKLCHGDSCLPEGIRNMFDYFGFDRQNAVDLWEILESVIKKFHGDAEKFYCSFYGLLQDNLLPNKFDGDITLTNMLLAEIGNHLLSFLASQNAFSDSTETLINLQHRGGLWRVNDNVQNIFIEREKIFRLSTSNFQTVINSAQLVQDMQGSPCVISNFDALCYNIEPKVNKEISSNLLENVLLLFAKSICIFICKRC